MSATLPIPSDCCSQCNGLTVTIVDNSGGGSGSGVIVCTTLAQLRAVNSSPLTSQSIAYLLGNLAIYDFGPAKTYYWDATNASADNPFSIVVPNDKLGGGNGRWVQVM